MYSCSRSKLSLSRLCGKVFSFVVMSSVMLWVVAVIVMRVYMFHTFYIHHLQTIENEKWLLKQCAEPAFFANLKQHVTLCAEVQENAQKNSFLVALNETMKNSSMCGMVQCWDFLQQIQNMGLTTVVVLSAVGVLMVAVVLPVVNVVSRFMDESSLLSGGLDVAELGGGRDNSVTVFEPNNVYGGSYWRSGHVGSGMVLGAELDTLKKRV